ncbi:MAG: TonB-dependent receptor, partial [Muribaculaceae bacterium]|nr:TonB-dependent receptor [Muribaculaceae bacterium]
NRIRNFVEYIYEDEWTNPISIDCGDTPIAFSPSLVMSNIFNFRWRNFDASLHTKYISDQYMNNARSEEARLDSYCVSDLLLGYSFKGLKGIKDLRLGFAVYNLFNKKYCNNGYASAGYTIENGVKTIYRYAGFAAQATTNVMGTVSLSF